MTCSGDRPSQRMESRPSDHGHGNGLQGGWRKREMSDGHDPQAERPPVTTTDAAAALWRRVDPDLGARIVERLGLAARRAPVEADTP